MKFVGIDLAWGEQKPSGVAVIDSQGVVQKAAANLIGNVEICQFAGLDSSEGAVIAIDAPLVVNNPGKCRPVEEMLTKTFWPYDAAPYPANLSNKAFQEAGRIRQLVKYLEAQGFMQSPIIPKQQEQQSFLEVFPSPALVMLFPEQPSGSSALSRPPIQTQARPSLGRSAKRMGDLSGSFAVARAPRTSFKVFR